MPAKKNRRHSKRHRVSRALADPSAGELLSLLSETQLRYLDLIPRDSLEEKIAHLVLEGQGAWGELGAVFDRLLDAIRRFSTDGIRTVVFGGGTGLSSILGGDTALASWPQSPFEGLKRHFPNFTVAVCTTDDGGSSGLLLRSLRCIALGDLRRAALSAITHHGLLSRYPDLYPQEVETVAAALQRIMNHRFGRSPDPSIVRQPSKLLSAQARRATPQSLLAFLDSAGKAFVSNPACKRIPLEGQCLGNLLLVGSIYGQRKQSLSAGSKRSGTPFSPSARGIVKGIHAFALGIGAGQEAVYPACSTQGELQVLYRHGVVSAGEDKSARGHSSFPVQRVWVHFVRKPQVDARLLEDIASADLIVFAPGSLYTSMIPIFQIPAISEAVKGNRRALKVLGGNFWAQRGETDISPTRRGRTYREYYVSDLLEAYHNNVPGGAKGLFEYVIVTDLQSIPGDILRNYALEGKVPIYLDKDRVREIGFEPIEAPVFSEQRLRNERVIQHDPEKFAQVLKTLCYLHQHHEKPPASFSLPPSRFDPGIVFPRKGYLCDHWEKARQRVGEMDIRDDRLRESFLEILWNNREILLEHLDYVQGIRMVQARHWARSTEWDKILGYYDPDDSTLKIHEHLLRGPVHRLREDLLIALGESLLGNYFARKSTREVREGGERLGKIFEIELRPHRKRRAFLQDRELREYLRLAQLIPSPREPGLFRMVINGNEAFTPPGLLFGLLYAWYVNNRFGGIVDYKMSLIRWKISELIPKPSMVRTRMQEQIDFFRRVVFRQRVPCL
jgi:uncharacterized cofD-like protein